jgi:VWFA-related protein
MIQKVSKGLSSVKAGRPFFRFWFLGLVSVLLRAQELPSSLELKKEVNLIQVPVIIRDKAGHAVTDLNVEDVSVYDNGKLQKIARFRYLQGQDGGRASEIARQAPWIEKAKEPHLLIVIPQLQFGSRLNALNALEKLFQQGSLGNENIAIVDNSLQVVPSTHDRNLLLQAVRKMRDLKISPCQGGPWATVAGQWMLQMRSMPGRKFLVIFSDGPELDTLCGIKRV